MIRRPPRSTRTDTRFPYTTLFRSDVVLAGPLHAHRRADRAGEPGRLDGEVALRLAAEAAAEQRHVDRHVLLAEAEKIGDVDAGAVGALQAAPDFALAVLEGGQRGRRLHRRMRQVRLVVLAREHAGRSEEHTSELQSLMRISYA